MFEPYPGTGLEPGVSQAFLSVYCAPGCGFQDATLDGKPQGLELARERGLSVFSTYVQTAPGTTSELALQLQRPDAWTGDELGGTYLLRIRAPDGPADAGTISIRRPRDGHRGRHAGHAGRRRPRDVEGDLPVQDFEIRFQRPPLGRFWGIDAGVRGLSLSRRCPDRRVGTVEQVPGRHEHLRPLEDDLLRGRVVGPPGPPVVGFAVAQHAHDEREAERAPEQPARPPGVERRRDHDRAPPPARCASAAKAPASSAVLPRAAPAAPVQDRRPRVRGSRPRPGAGRTGHPPARTRRAGRSRLPKRPRAGDQTVAQHVARRHDDGAGPNRLVRRLKEPAGENEPRDEHGEEHEDDTQRDAGSRRRARRLVF